MSLFSSCLPFHQVQPCSLTYSPLETTPFPAGNMLKAAYAHNIDAYQSVGAEVSKAAREDAANVHVMLGYSKRLTDGALVKARVQNSGLVTLLYESVSSNMCLLFGRCSLMLGAKQGSNCLIMSILLPCFHVAIHVVVVVDVLCGD